jgi:hypothetical protein
MFSISMSPSADPDLTALRGELKVTRSEIDRHLGSWEYAFAMGHGCSMGKKAPEEKRVVERIGRLFTRKRDIEAVLQEFEVNGGSN